MFNAGDQFPLIPLFDTDGNGDKVAPSQRGAAALKVGTVAVFTVMIMFAVLAHCPVVGVKL